MRTIRTIYHYINGPIIDAGFAEDLNDDRLWFKLAFEDRPIESVEINNESVPFTYDEATGRYYVKFPPNGQKIHSFKILQAGEATNNAILSFDFGKQVTGVSGLTKLVQKVVRYFFSSRGGGMWAMINSSDISVQDLSARIAVAVMNTATKIQTLDMQSKIPLDEQLLSLTLKTIHVSGTSIYAVLEVVSRTGNKATTNIPVTG